MEVAIVFSSILQQHLTAVHEIQGAESDTDLRGGVG